MATQYANATYTEVIDLQTVADKISIIGIHTPVGRPAYHRLKGFFTQFRKYKYNGIKSLVMVPAAQLPVDPLGLTGVVGTTDTMDPRDSLNPILFHGCHGESLTQVLDTIYRATNYVSSGANTTSDGGDVSDSAEKYDMNISNDLFQYYSKLTDSSWRKFGIQSGVKLKKLHPLVHQVVQNMPTLPGAMSSEQFQANTGLFQTSYANTSDSYKVNSHYVNDVQLNDHLENLPSVPVGETDRVRGVVNGDYVSTNAVVPVYKQQFTNRLTSLGWLPTALVGNNSEPVDSRICTLPRIFMGIMVLPPAYNVEQYFRMVITHSFSFKEFTSTLSLADDTWNAGSSVLGSKVPYYNWIDYGSAAKDTIEDIDYGSTTDSINAKAEVISDGVS